MFRADPERDPVPRAVRTFIELPGRWAIVPGRAYNTKKYNGENKVFSLYGSWISAMDTMPVNGRPVDVLGLLPDIPIMDSCLMAVCNVVPGRGAVAKRFVSKSSFSVKYKIIYVQYHVI